MPTLCIQCAMKALVEGQPAPTFEEEPEEHYRRLHSDQQATQKERADLERRLAEILPPRPLGGPLG